MIAVIDRQPSSADAVWYGLWADGDGGAYWWFGGEGEEPTAGHLAGDVLGPLMQRLDAALPQQREGESLSDAVERARNGALAQPDMEHALADDLGAALLPDALRTRLATRNGDEKPVLVIAPGTGLSRVPFELLTVGPDTDRRLLEDVIIRGGISPANLHGRARIPIPVGVDSTPLRIVDPSPNGHRFFTDPLAPGLEHWWDRDPSLVTTWSSEYGETDRAALGAMLTRRPPPSRLMFFGHAISGAADKPAGAGIQLRDGLFTAAHWMRDPDRWPAPPLVAFIACHSNDTQHHEQMGLVFAAANAGAHTITSTRWTLPTDAHAPGGYTGATPTNSLALAVDTAHDTGEPIAHLREWQLGQLERWRAGNPAASPLIWAAPISYHANAPRAR